MEMEKKTVYTPSGEEYITMWVSSGQFKFILHKYSNEVTVHLDEKVLPEINNFIMEYLKMKEEHVKNTKAQRLAENLAKPWTLLSDQEKAAAELRRLDALVGELVEALEEVRRDIQHLAKGHFVHLPTVEEELSEILAKAKGGI